jgi:hypothetical protein
LPCFPDPLYQLLTLNAALANTNYHGSKTTKQEPEILGELAPFTQGKRRTKGKNN